MAKIELGYSPRDTAKMTIYAPDLFYQRNGEIVYTQPIIGAGGDFAVVLASPTSDQYKRARDYMNDAVAKAFNDHHSDVPQKDRTPEMLRQIDLQRLLDISIQWLLMLTVDWENPPLFAENDNGNVIYDGATPRPAEDLKYNADRLEEIFRLDDRIPIKLINDYGAAGTGKFQAWAPHYGLNSRNR